MKTVSSEMNDAFSFETAGRRLSGFLRNLPLGAKTGPACDFVNEKATLKTPSTICNFFNSAEKRSRRLKRRRVCISIVDHRFISVYGKYC